MSDLQKPSGQVGLKHDYNLSQFFFADDLKVKTYSDQNYFDYFNTGKQLRAKLTESFGSLLKVRKENSRIIARAVEMIHNATLTHDDVIDESSWRRSSNTVNKSLGNKKSVLVGDYMLARALTELSVLGSPDIMKDVSFCLKSLVDGEWFQMESVDPFEVSTTDYVRLAMCKTGSLFGVCFSGPYHLYNNDQRSVVLLKNIGDQLGLLFQINDDLLDFSLGGGKTPYLDFKNNNPNILFSFVNTLISQEDKKELLELEDFKSVSDGLRDKFKLAAVDVKKYHSQTLDSFRATCAEFINLNKDLPAEEVGSYFKKIESYFKIKEI